MSQKASPRVAARTGAGWSRKGLLALNRSRGARLDLGPHRHYVAPVMTTARSASGYDLTPPTPSERAELEAKLTPEQRRILLASGTERPFCGGLLGNKETGAYHCGLCDLPLFNSGSK